MKKLLNTLYVTSQDSYLSLDGENVVVMDQEKEIGRVPLHNLEAIVSFGYRGASPALMGGCAGRNISLCFLTPQGKYLARVYLKIHFRHLHIPLRGIFGPNSVNVARYASLIGAKSPTKCDAQLTKSNFQIHS